MNIDGEWRIRVTSGPWWFRWLNWLRDVKIIYSDRGHNFAWGVKCGKFKVLETPLLPGKPGEIVLTYDNGKIVDRVYYITENELIGEFYWKTKFVGKFQMFRIKEIK